MKERVQKLMAQANIGSRRAAEELIRAGRVRVNGKVVELGTKADPETDVIEVDGERLLFDQQRKVYYAVNKPLNVLSSSESHHKDQRKTVRELLPVEGHLFTIGRLDAESEGLMVLTNDGDMAQRITHPRYGHTKTYKVMVYGLPSRETIEQWENGIYLEEGKTAPCSVQIIKGGKEVTTLRIVMTEGKKRQIRRVATQLGHPVKRLIRTHIGQLELGTLREGEWTQLRPADAKKMLLPGEEMQLIRQRQKRVVAKPKPRPKTNVKQRQTNSKFSSSKRSDRKRRAR
jgi:23S rRNA pseudouridine2605 synthase